MALIFRSKAGADVLMLQADAERVLAALGKEPSCEGIVLPEHVEGLLARFVAHTTPPTPLAEEDSDDEGPVDVARRAWPLLELLRAARARGVPVVWSPA